MSLGKRHRTKQIVDDGDIVCALLQVLYRCLSQAKLIGNIQDVFILQQHLIAIHNQLFTNDVALQL